MAAASLGSGGQARNVQGDSPRPWLEKEVKGDNTMEYEALFEPDKEMGGFVVTFPDFGYGVTQGDTEEEAMEMAADLLICLLTDRIEKIDALPDPRSHKGKKYRRVPLPALVSAKVALYREFLASGIRKAELGRRTGIGKTNIDKLFNLRRHTRMEQIEAALAAIGKKLLIGVGEAA
jgi:antitoxin HicB